MHIWDATRHWRPAVFCVSASAICRVAPAVSSLFSLLLRGGGVLFLTLSRNKEHRTTLCAYTMCMYITVRRLKDPRALLLTRCIAVVPFYRILELPPVLPLGSRTWCLHRTHVASAIYSDSRAEPRVVWRRSLRDARHGKPITVAQLFSLAELFSFAVS